LALSLEDYIGSTQAFYISARMDLVRGSMADEFVIFDRVDVYPSDPTGDAIASV
jgi:hypothetical protein